MDLQESGGKNCQVVGAHHNLKLDPNGLFKVAVPVWIFRDLCTALERGQRQRRQRQRRQRECEKVWQDTCKDADGAISAKNAIRGGIVSHFR